ncbi:hypothetical protein D3C81_1836480 [compost metagenome]
MVAREALEPFALARGQAANTSSPLGHCLATAGTFFTCVKSLGFQRVRDLASDAYRDLAACVGVAAAMSHGSKSWSNLASVGTVVFAAEGDRRFVRRRQGMA